MTPGLAKQVTEVTVDENEAYKLKGKTKSDHNTIIVEIDLQMKTEKKKIKRWNLNNKEGWKKYNKHFQEKFSKEKPQNQAELQKLITTTLKETIGEKTITIGGKKGPKESEQIRELKDIKKEKQNEFETAIKEDRDKIQQKMKEYFEAQTKLREQIENQNRIEAKDRLQKFKVKNGTKSVHFWRMKAEAEAEIQNDYDTITEEGKLLQGPEETKEYIANYFEDLYQARPSKPSYEQSTKEIEENVKEIEQQMREKPKIPEFTAEELKAVIKKLKRKKAAGPDNIPNEIFIEADHKTREIYRKNFNEISENLTIPQIWQDGELKRLWKNKGIKGKCSNERGITLSTNYGKVYERLVNERVIEMVNISDDQAGGKRGSATVDHIVLAKEIIRSAKASKKNVDIALLDVTKAYDKAWLTGIMHVLHKQGLTDNHWTIVKKLNENLTAKIQTKYGLTRTIKILDSIRQGGVLSTTMYGALMDEIAKELKKENLGIPIWENGEKKATLLWVDDVLLLAYENELQKSLDTTDDISNKYHIEYGESKSNSMPIKNNRKKGKKHEYKLGDMELKETNKYKYLGYNQNSKNNNEDHFKSIKGTAEAAFQHMLSLTGNTNFSEIEMITIWEIMETCILPLITYSGEAWDSTTENYKQANQIYEALIRRILKVPQGTPNEALYCETGLLNPETVIKKNRINMEARIRNGNNENMKQILESKIKESWIEQNDKIKQQLGIKTEDMKKKRTIIKSIARNNSYENFKKTIEETAQTKSKMKYYMENLQRDWQPRKRPEYIEQLTRNQVSTIFKARTRMLKTKANYKNGNSSLICRLCRKEEETQEHILESCEELNKKHKIATKPMIFSEKIKELKETIKIIDTRMETLENTGIPSYKESKKQKEKQRADQQQQQPERLQNSLSTCSL